MKYTVFGFSQEELIKHKMDLGDAAILRFFVDFRGTGKMKSEIIGENDQKQSYYWLKYNAVIEDFPLLNMKKDAVYRRMKSLVDKGILIHQHVKNKYGSFSYYEVGPLYESLLRDKKQAYQPDEKPEGGRANHRGGSGENPRGVGPNTGANNPSTSNPSTKPVITNVITREPVETGLFENDPKKLGGKIDKHILSIIKQCMEIGEYKHKLPAEGKPASKIIKRCVMYLKQIKSGEFKRISIDTEWSDKFIKKWPDPKGYKTWGKVRTLVMDSMTSCMIDYNESRKLKTGLWKAPNLDQFFYNIKHGETHGKSMFLKYMNVSPKSAQEKTTDWQKNRIPEKIQNKIEDMLINLDRPFSGNNLLQFWSTMNSLHSWYVDNDEDLRKYNEAYYDNNWGYHCGHDWAFFEYVIDFLTYQTGRGFPPRVMNITDSNGYWRSFKAWMLNNHKIAMDIDETAMKNTDKAIKSNQDERRERRIQIRQMEIERMLDAEGINATGDQIRAKAIAEIDKEIAEEDAERSRG